MEIKKNINVNSEIINNEFGGEGLKQALSLPKNLNIIKLRGR